MDVEERRVGGVMSGSHYLHLKSCCKPPVWTECWCGRQTELHI